MMKHILYCEDSPEGILSAVHEAYTLRYGHADTEIRTEGRDAENMELFAQTTKVPLNQAHAASVRDALIRKIGSDAYDMIMYTALSNAPDKADVIYHFLVRGFANGEKTVDFYSDPYVARLRTIDRKVSRETCHWNEFLRFREHTAQMAPALMLPEGANMHTLMTSRITPEARVVVLIMPHFSDRFPEENFLIYDSVHDEAGIHAAGGSWYISQQIGRQFPEIAALTGVAETAEEEVERLWKAFFDTIEIKQRHNTKLQQSLMPLKFRVS
ncbi:MAG: TIGR03915 family putative DNA repair protein [Butyrivibrio sp.]|jgi:probable DNA metabolism protein|nr:TIGR03915 family putative DNA repair protein [Butyrivibrio sp.]